MNGVKRTFAVMSVLFLVLSLATVSAATTATQNVTLSITESYQGIAAIRIFNGETTNPLVQFGATNTGTYTASTAGLQAEEPVYTNWSGITEKSGGSIQYTTGGLSGNQKITVHTGTSSYISESLYVALTNIQDSTAAAVTTIGTVVDSTVGTDPEQIFNITSTAQDIITDIPGDDSYTGTEAGDYVPGAPIVYGFNSDPGVGTIAVTYTITADAV